MGQIYKHKDTGEYKVLMFWKLEYSEYHKEHDLPEDDYDFDWWAKEYLEEVVG